MAANIESPESNDGSGSEEPAANSTSNGRTTPRLLNVRDPDEMDRVEEILTNVMSMRRELIRSMLDPRRDIDDECGYPKGEVETGVYQTLYNRDAIAVRVVQVLPKECWQVQPLVYENESGTVFTAFEKAWRELGRQLRPGSLYQDDEENLVWEYMRRADELSGIGRYGILLIGVNDSQDLSKPADLSGNTKHKLLFLRTLPEALVTISEREKNVSNPRFGQPTIYSITFEEPGSSGDSWADSSSREVHWSRVIHVADNLDSSEIFGAPRMRPVLNRLLDLHKLYGGSAEMYWRGAFPGISFESHPQLSPKDLKLDEAKLKDMMENYANGLQRYLALVGMTAKPMAPQVVDPTPQIRVQIEAICIRLGVPKRIFMGSERGELASAQDDKTWNDRLKERQRNYITPRIIVPLVDRLIMMGILPRPVKYRIHWPALDFQTESDRVRVGIIKTEALVRYLQTIPNPMISPSDFWTRILSMTDQEAKTVLENAERFIEQWEKKHPEHALMMRSAISQMVAKETEGIADKVIKDAESGKNKKDGTSKGIFIKPMQGSVVIDPDQTLKLPGGASKDK